MRTFRWVALPTEYDREDGKRVDNRRLNTQRKLKLKPKSKTRTSHFEYRPPPPPGVKVRLAGSPSQEQLALPMPHEHCASRQLNLSYPNRRLICRLKNSNKALDSGAFQGDKSIFKQNKKLQSIVMDIWGSEQWL